MKSNNHHSFIPALALTFVMSGAMSKAQLFSSVEAQNNWAIAQSPRAKEVFPWLTRTVSDSGEARCPEAIKKIRMNSALAASPRVIEMTPELGRPVHERKSAGPPGLDPLVAASRNQSFATSPRVLEMFPSLSRGVDS